MHDVSASQPASSVSRRRFVGAAALGATALGMTAATSAFAADASASKDAPAAAGSTFADTIAWDAEYDVVVLGIGFAGMAAAIAAADEGAAVLLCEKAEEGESGGNSKVCAQFFIDGHGDPDAVVSYFKGMAGGRLVDDEVYTTFANSVATMGDIIAERYGLDSSQYIDAGTLGLAAVDYLSPEYPEFAGSEKISFMLSHMGYSDSFLYQSVKKQLKARSENIDVWFETPGVELVQDPVSRAVIGAVVERKGERRFVRALNGVCLCTGGFENNPQMIQYYLDCVNMAPIGGLANTGDGIVMAQSVGAQLWNMGSYERDCTGGLGAVCYNVGEGQRANMVNLGDNGEMLNGAVMLVGTWGKRFLNESVPVRHGHLPNGNGQWENPRFPERFWVVYDQTQADLIEAGGVIPESFVGDVQAFDTAADMAAALNMPEEALAQTIADFNFFAENGHDYEFGRDASTMRPFDGVKFYAIPLKNAILNTQGGPKHDAQAQVLDMADAPIPHLYAAGELGSLATYMYQGGTNVTECLVFGEIAGRNAAAAKEALPAYEGVPGAEFVTSTPAHLGDETDLVADDAAGASEDGMLVGTADGMGGTVSVAVTTDADGRIATVEVTRQSETEGIGTKAIDELPLKFLGLSSADEIDAVDAVSGATVTSNALKAAVKAALGL